AAPSPLALHDALPILPIAAAVSARPNLTPLLIGGQVRPRTQAAVGPWAARLLEQTYVDVGFIATNGVSAERGLTTPDTSEAETRSEEHTSELQSRENL